MASFSRSHQNRNNPRKQRTSANPSNVDDATSRTVALSKALSWLLRHNAVKEGLQVDGGGWVDLSAVLKHSRFTQWTVEDVKNVVANNDKQRFSLREVGDEGTLEIRANQGHSYKVDDDQLLESITNEQPESIPGVVIHGTYFRNWNSIKTSGLSRMSRNHIHFAAGELNTEGVISGMRNSAQVYIYVDIVQALNDGIKFFRSANNVILSPGNEAGYLEPKYFLKVMDAKSKKDLILQ